MRMTQFRRTVALITSAALLASMTVATVAAPTSAAKPKCFGKTATIVGTNKGERIVGTNKRDVIVAKGGNDRIFGRGGNDLICGGNGADRIVGGPGIDKLLGNNGPDRLFGGPGPDRLFPGVGNDVVVGGPGNDVIDGGPGTDTCYQNLGAGPVVRCELPPVVPVVPVAPSPPTLIPLGEDILVIAYSDIDGLPGYSSGDVMITQLVDTDPGGQPSRGDTIVMDQYPTKLRPTASDFAPWGKTSHIVANKDSDFQDGTVRSLRVTSVALGVHNWIEPVQVGGSINDEYREGLAGTRSQIGDDQGSGSDYLEMNPSSPSQPGELPYVEADGTGDGPLIDVEIRYVKP